MCFRESWNRVMGGIRFCESFCSFFLWGEMGLCRSWALALEIIDR